VTPSVGFFRLLRTRRFGPLLLAQALGAFNDNLFKQALIISLAYGGVVLSGARTETAVLVATTLYVAPFFLFSAIAGQMADKFERSALVRRIKTLEIGLMALAALGFFLGSAPILLASIFLAGAQSAFFQPVKNALMPDYLAREELAVGNGVMSGATFLSILAGTIAGALLVRHPLGGLLFCLTAVGAALAGRLGAGAAPQTAAGAPGARIRWNAITESVRLIVHALSHAGLARPFLGTLWVWVMGAAIIAVMPIYARNVLGGDPSVAAVLMSVFFVGAAIGSLASGALAREGRGRAAAPVGALLMSGCAAVLTATPVVAEASSFTDAAGFAASGASWAVMAALFGLSFGGGLFVVPHQALLQLRSPAAARARVMAANDVATALATTVTILTLMWAMGEGASATALFAAIGAINAAVFASFGLAAAHARA